MSEQTAKKGKVTVDLRIYKGKELLYKGDGSVQNENQSLKLTYGDTQWAKHLANLPKLGICKVEVSNVYEGESKIETPQNIIDEVSKVLQLKETELTAEQKQIKELTARLDAFTKPKGDPAIDVKEPVVTDELAALRTEYETLFGKKGYGAWTAEQLKEKIEAKKNESK